MLLEVTLLGIVDIILLSHHYSFQYSIQHCTKMKKVGIDYALNTNIIKVAINETRPKRKFVFITINNMKMKLQHNTGSDITIINEKTWRKESKPSLLTSRKVARGVLVKKLNFFDQFTCKISFV